MDKESIFELQKIDCNCNDCKFMVRDFETYAKWEQWNKVLQEKDFEQKRKEAFRIANDCQDEVGKKSLLATASKMRFMFDKSDCIQYGNCSKFNKSVSFLPGTCQIQTQECFQHRREIII